VALRLVFYSREDAMQGCLLEVGQIHGDLRQATRAQVHRHSFDKGKPAAGGPHGSGDALRDFEVGRVEIDVVSDQELACPDGNGTGGRMQARLSNIGRAAGITLYGFAQAFEATFANVGEAFAFRANSRGLVKINRDAVALPDFAAGGVCERGAVFERDARNGNEGKHVCRADARMLAAMLAKIDEFGGRADGAERSFENCFWAACDGDYGAIVVGIAGTIEKQNAGYGANRGGDSVDYGYIGAFREIRHAFDKAPHPEIISES